ncbi:MAG: hypothetical protein KA143_01800 [Saprospiraceae bacterium]|nr:hypothetical protein [Saprospiraceae bacterium]
MSIKLFSILLLLILSAKSFSQDMNPFIASPDLKYYHFLPGKWYLQNEDKSLDTLNSFIIKQGVHEANFIEEWNFNKMGKSMAIRTWDKTNNKWGFVWISENGLYQVWDSKKVEDKWYIYKWFTINGETYLSRQGFFMQPDGTVLRISEKSLDEQHWELRFKQILVKAPKK